jgi:hypothetical protein
MTWDSLNALIAAGALPVVEIGKSHRQQFIREEDFRAFIEARRERRGATGAECAARC